MTGARTAATAGLIGCKTCHLLCRVTVPVQGRRAPYCPRCGALLRRRKENSLARTWALIIAAGLLYLPANLIPITRSTSLGSVQEDTIMSGVIYFVKTGSWFVALVIFVASILVPLLKLIILTFLLISVQRGWKWRPRDRALLYRITEGIGRWSMIDIFVITITVALVKLGALADIQAMPGGIFFGAVVVLTMLAAEAFDPRLIWDAMEENHD